MLLSKCSNLLRNSPSWEAFVSEVHGPSSLQERISPHPAGSSWRPYTSTGPMRPVRRRLDLELLDERMARGCHRSATEHRDFIREEMADFVESGFYVVPYPRYDTCLDSGYPLGIKEERDRRARLVVDHTWFLINQHTLEWTTKEAMQFGGALPHPAKIYHADPKYGPVYLASTTSRTVSTA
jgi:hypothetical protein